MKKTTRYITLVCLVLSLAFAAKGQVLVAGFEVTDLSGTPTTSGCIPLILQFTDASTFNGSQVPLVRTRTGGPYNSHTWIFDKDTSLSNMGPDSQVVHVRNPVFGWFEPGFRNVTLIITNDGVNYDTASVTIEVFNPPTAAFTANDTFGCNPSTFQFTDQSFSPGDSIVAWLWDFGDGSVSNQQNPTHQFRKIPGANNNCFRVSLQVTNGQGCTGTTSIVDYICLAGPPEPDFTAMNRTICDSPYVVNFVNTTPSNGRYPYRYMWDFGDSTFSNLTNPTHAYADSGYYTVKLIAEDTVCNEMDSITKVDYIQAVKIVADFTVDTTVVCANTPINFYNQSTDNALSYYWDFGYNGRFSVAENPVFTYPAPGTYTVTLIISEGFGCADTVVKNNYITVLPEPTALFTTSASTSCQAPFQVDFTDTSTPAAGSSITSYYWDFDNDSTSTDMNPSHIYTDAGNYSVSLFVTDANGCTDSYTLPSPIVIEPTIVSFTMDSAEGCAPLTTYFTDQSSSIDGIQSWSWDFGDPGSGANFSNSRNDTHTYQIPGTYTATLTIVTNDGCVATITQTVVAGSGLVPEFTANPIEVCVGDPITFVNQTNDAGIAPGDINWTWDMGGSDVITDRDPDPYAFDEPGQYQICLEVSYNGCTTDTCLDVNVNDPKAEFSFTQNCVNPAQVLFANETIGGHLWEWTFGYVGTPTVTTFNTVHTFPSSGDYTVQLIAQDTVTGCADTVTHDLTISILNADFAGSGVCMGAPVQFTDFSTGLGLSYLWDFQDTGIATVPNPTYIYSEPGDYTIKLVITDINGCQDSMIKPNYIQVAGVRAFFDSDRPEGCIPPTGNTNLITFNDSSSSFPSGTNLVNWQWDFGDGNGSTYGVPQQSNVDHLYGTKGLYNVKLTVRNDLGCIDSFIRNDYVDINRPVAGFNLDYNLYCTDQTIPLQNTTTGSISSYSWIFDDTLFRSNRTPSVSFVDTGLHSVSLTVVDILGCRDSLYEEDYFKTDNPELGFLVNDTSSVCPPHLGCFSNLSTFDTIDIDFILWDFGDGSASILDTPCHLYTEAGFFTVSVQVEFENSCVDSLAINNYISVGGATGDLTLENDTGCAPLTVNFDANSSDNAVNHFWIWGDGNPGFSTEDTTTASHTYENPGLYIPAVVLTDTQSPACSWVLYSDYPVLADTVYADFMMDVDTVCREAQVQFTDMSSSLLSDEIVNWDWDFGDGESDTIQNPTHAFSDTIGNHTICLTVVNSYGCTSTRCRDIYVRDKPTAGFTMSDTSGCDDLTVFFTNISTAGVTAPIVNRYWDFGDPAVTTDNSVVPNPPPYQYDTGSYMPSLIVTDAEGCMDTATGLVNVYRTPSGISQSSVSICYGDTTQLDSEDGPYQYEWTPSTGLSNDTIADPLAFPTATTTYTLTTFESNGCDFTDSIIVTVIPLPVLVLSPYPDTMVCTGDTIQLDASGGQQYIWSPDTYLSDPNIHNPVAIPFTTQTYTMITTGVGGCQSTDSLTVQVNNFTPEFLGEDACFPDASDFFDLSTTSDRPVTGWAWDFDLANPGMNTDNIANPTFSYPDTGYYDAQLVVFDDVGCSDTVVHTIRVDIQPEPNAYDDAIICIGDSVQIFAEGGDTVFWTPTFDNRSSFSPFVSPQISTTYTANITNGVCPFEQASVFVEVIPLPVVETIEDQEILRGTLIDLTTFIDKYDSISWTPADSLNCSDCVSPAAGPYFTTTYIVTAVDEYGCYNSDTVNIRVVVECGEEQVFMPTAFTPNGDGWNDELYARLFGVEKINYFKVYDRWGRLLFETEDHKLGWNGTDMDGKQLNSGVYVYMVEAVCFDRNTIVKSGNITLIK